MHQLESLAILPVELVQKMHELGIQIISRFGILDMASDRCSVASEPCDQLLQGDL